MKKYVLTGIKVICTLAFMHGLVLNAKAQSKSSMSSDCISGNCFCIQGSLDFANVNYSSSGSSISYKSRTGFNLGVFVFHPFPTNMKAGSLLLKGGLEFIQKGYSYNSGGSKETLTLGYLEIPIDILYQYPLANCNSIYGGLGPYFAYGLGGKDKYSYAGQTVSGNSFSDSTAKRFDAGLQITVGFRMSCQWSFSIAYELGLVNIAQSVGSSSYTAKNHVWSFNVAYCFGDLMGNKK